MAGSSTLTIRAACTQDAADILTCLSLAFEPYRSLYTARAYEETVLGAVTIHQRLADMSVLLAVQPPDGIVGTIAYATTSGGDGHIRGMAVSPHWHGQGVAVRLLHRAEAALREKGCRRATLDTSRPLDRALRFYTKQGYLPSGRTKEFFGMELIELVKTLD